MTAKKKEPCFTVYVPDGERITENKARGIDMANTKAKNIDDPEHPSLPQKPSFATRLALGFAMFHGKVF